MYLVGHIAAFLSRSVFIMCGMHGVSVSGAKSYHPENAPEKPGCNSLNVQEKMVLADLLSNGKSCCGE